MTRTGVFVALLCGVVGLAVGLEKRRRSERHCGYNLVPVVVAAVDIAAGTKVTFDMISQRSMPEHFVTSSVVKPDSASDIVNQVIDRPLLAGDLLRWNDFPSAMSRELRESERAVRVEIDGAPVKGDHVDLWMNGMRVAEAGEVMSSVGERRWVKVAPSEAELVMRSSGEPKAVLRPRR